MIAPASATALRYAFFPRRWSSDIALLALAFASAGVEVHRWSPGDPWSPPPDATAENATVCGSLRNGRAVAALLGTSLAEPADDLLPSLPHALVNRRVELTTLERARALAAPAFVKPAAGKTFAAAVYVTGADLIAPDLPGTEPVLVAEPVAWGDELRAFVLDGTVRALWAYAERDDVRDPAARRREAMELCARVVAAAGERLPRGVVLDVGTIRGRGWSLVEANPVAASDVYGCDPHAVIGVLRHAFARGRQRG